MNETCLPPSEDDHSWQQAEMARDEAFRRHEVEEAFSLLYRDWAISIQKKEWELLAQALEDRFPGFLKFYRSL